MFKVCIELRPGDQVTLRCPYGFDPGLLVYIQENNEVEFVDASSGFTRLEPKAIEE